MIAKVFSVIFFIFFLFFTNIVFAESITAKEIVEEPIVSSAQIASESSDVQKPIPPETPTTNPTTEPLAPASEIEIEYQNEKNLFLPRFSNYIALFRPSYVLPFYYTKSPDYAVYEGYIPDNQTLKHEEFKAQLSVYLPLVKNLFYNKNVSINVSYTQLIYWQLYTHSPWFRETNYEPNVALRFRMVRNMFGEISLDHQSNGRGGNMERSWNRVIGTLEFSTENFFAQINGWFLVFTGASTHLYNPHIAWYLGYDKIILSYRLFKKLVLSVEANNIESGYKRGFFMFTGFYPFTTKFGAYLQYFNGYGQSLIEYNHRTQSFGIGFALNDWQ